MPYDPRSTERVRRALLGLLGRSGLPDAGGEAPLSADEWKALGGLARRHRLEPLLHARIQAEGTHGLVPPALREAWREADRQSVLRSLALKGALIRIARALDGAGIAWLAMKGAWLAWHAYGNPAMRPMRDLDVLVPESRLEAAYRALAAAGFTESTGQPFSAETLASGLKHLPALCDSSSGVAVELHSRLFAHLEPTHSRARLTRPEALIAARQLVPMDHAQVAYPPVEDTLLHLIVHCFYEHRFDNGPQVLHDIAALLSGHGLDWPRFWAEADAGGWTQGSALLLGMTEQMLGPQPIGWRGAGLPEIPAEVLDSATMLLLQDPDLRRDLDVQMQLGSLGSGGSAKALLGRFFPARRVVADYAGVSRDRRRAWLHYPAWLASRLVRTARGMFDRRQRIEAERAVRIDIWLASQAVVPGDGVEPPTP